MQAHPITSPDTSAPDTVAEVRRLVSLVLQRPIGESENPSRDTEPAWDSLKHVEIVFLMEDHFGIRFTEPELDDIQHLGDLTRLVAGRLPRTSRCSEQKCATAP